MLRASGNETTHHDLTGRRVFVVEDETMVALLIEDSLADLGCEIVGMAWRFDDALEKANSLSYDVAILDVNLNGDQTFPIAESLAERGQAFVFATGHSAANLPASLRNAPILHKPFDKLHLESALRTALGY
jgi:DNA-binding response OmpR family regulator